MFQGRFKSILAEKEAHLLELARYIVLNPSWGMESYLFRSPTSQHSWQPLRVAMEQLLLDREFTHAKLRHGSGIHAPNVALSYIKGNIGHQPVCKQMPMLGEKAHQETCRPEERVQVRVPGVSARFQSFIGKLRTKQCKCSVQVRVKFQSFIGRPQTTYTYT